jgi:hypothetical protein
MAYVATASSTPSSFFLSNIRTVNLQLLHLHCVRIHLRRERGVPAKGAFPYVWVVLSNPPLMALKSSQRNAKHDKRWRFSRESGQTKQAASRLMATMQPDNFRERD